MNDDTPPEEVTGYDPPTIVRLGSLAELTQGGTVGISDGNGTGGDVGSG